MSFDRVTDSWHKAKKSEIQTWFRRARGYLTGLQRYWSLHESSYQASLSRELTDLERRLFWESFRSFEFRIRFVKGYFKKINAELTRVGFWRAINHDKEQVLKTIASDKTRPQVDSELRDLGFNLDQTL